MPGMRGPVPVPVENESRNLTQDILDLLDTKDTLQSNEDFPTTSQAEIKAALDRLASRSMVEYKSINTDKVALTPEAEGIVEQGSHEFRVWKAIKERGSVTMKELPVRCIWVGENGYMTDIGHIGYRRQAIRKRRTRKWFQEQVDQERW